MPIPPAPDTATPTDLGFGFPFVVIDFEATALTLSSYPIEAGVARAVSQSAQIEVWSSLIAPAPQWDLPQQWDPDAERVHGISRWQLRAGVVASDVMQMLNDFVGQTDRVWCDGGHYDALWLETLAEAAGIRPMFTLCDIAALFGADQLKREKYDELLRQSTAPHRAGPDAQRICAALLAAMTLT